MSAPRRAPPPSVQGRMIPRALSHEPAYTEEGPPLPRPVLAAAWTTTHAGAAVHEPERAVAQTEEEEEGETDSDSHIGEDAVYIGGMEQDESLPAVVPSPRHRRLVRHIAPIQHAPSSYTNVPSSQSLFAPSINCTAEDAIAATSPTLYHSFAGPADPHAHATTAAGVQAVQSLAALAVQNAGHTKKKRPARRRRSGSDSGSDSDADGMADKRDKGATGGGGGGGDGGDSGDDEDDFEDLAPLPSGTELLMRAGMCLVSLALLWVTSLSLAEHIAASAVGTPSFAPVSEGWVRAWDTAGEAGDAQEGCLTSLFASCDQRLNDTILAREREWEHSVAMEANRTAEIAARASMCAATSKAQTQSINAWMQAGAAMVYRSALCSSGEVESLRTILQDRRANEEEIQGQTANFLSQTRGALQHTRGQLGAVQDYNALFVANQSMVISQGFRQLQSHLSAGLGDTAALQASIDARLGEMHRSAERLGACVSARGGANNLCPGGTVVDSFAGAMGQMAASYANLQSMGQANLRQVVLYSASVSRKFSEVQSFFNLLYPVASVLSSVNIDILSLPRLDVPPLIPSSAFAAALASAPELPDAGAYFSAHYGPICAAWGAEWAAQEAEVRRALGAALGNMSQAIQSSFPQDPLAWYDPPAVEVDLAEVEARLDASARAFQAQQAASVAALVALPQAGRDAFEEHARNASKDFASLAANVSSLRFSLPPVSSLSLNVGFEGFSGSFGLSDTILLLLTAMGGVALLGDYVYRATGSVRTVRQYARAPQEMLPVVDARTKESKKAADEAASRSASFVTKLGYYASHSGTLVLVALVFAVWILSLLLAAYIPFFHSYRSGCVDSHNGTFVSANAFSVLSNYATLRAHRRMPLQLSMFEARRMAACGRYEQRFVAQQTEQSGSVASSLATQRAAWRQMSLMHKCIHGAASFDETLLPPNASVDALSDPMEMFTSDTMSQCALHADASLGGADADSSSSASAGSPPYSPYSSSSSSGSFNCSWLPACALGSCPGPAPLPIRSTTHDASCATEHALHHSLLYFTLVGLIFLCMNLSRQACLSALVRLGWRALTPAGITFMATCDHSGRHLQAEGEDEKGRRRKKKGKSRDSRSDSGSSSESGSDSSWSSSSDSSDSSDSSVSSASSRRSRRRNGKHRPSASSSHISRKLLRQFLFTYEQSASRFLVLMIVAHVPYLLLLLVLIDPLNTGSALRIAPPRPYQDFT